MDLKRIAETLVSQADLTAAANPAVAKAISDLVKTTIQPLLGKLNPDFGYDALSSGVRGQSEDSFSFPARPDDFNKANLNGTLLVKGTLIPPVQGSGKEIAGKATVVNLEGGFFFKTPKMKGAGKYMFPTPAGKVDISFDANGSPQLKDPADLVDLVDALEQLNDHVLENHPPEAKSLTRDPQLRKEQAEINELARQNQAEKARETEQAEAAQAQREADEAIYGSVDAFVKHMDEMDEDEYGPAELQKLVNTQFRDPASRAIAQGEVKKQLDAEGMVFNPKKRHLSSRREGLDLLRIAARVAQTGVIAS
jgi:hypothetical protein